MDFEDLDLEIEISYKKPLFPNDLEPFWDYINTVFIQIISEDDNLKKKVIGTGTIYLLRLQDAYFDDVDIYSVLDQHEYVFRIFENLIDLDESLFVFNKHEEEIENCLLIENIKIDSNFQGKGLFSHIIRHIENLYGNKFPFKFLEAYPLQFSIKDMEDGNHFEQFHLKHKDIGKVQAKKKLREVYSKSGFKSTKVNTNIMYKYGRN